MIAVVATKDDFRRKLLGREEVQALMARANLNNKGYYPHNGNLLSACVADGKGSVKRLSEIL